MNSLVGRNKQLYTQLKTVINSELADKGRSLATAGRNSGGSPAKNKTALQALYLLNQETLETTIGFSKNPSAKLSEYDGALALSAAQIEGFSRFSEPYVDFAVNYLNKKDIKGNDLPKGVIENMNPDLKDRFCIQALSMTELSPEILKLCQNAIISSGDVKLEFNLYSQLNHQERACAYYNFSTRERAASQNKIGR
ncbi:MAG: hypothetical protein KA715_08995 [Xanthomonadaceae bacterium]|nr:hypothetical protein [Xanthomonadaceae bacterium]